MTTKRLVLAVVAAFAVSQILAVVVHGLVFVSAMVWIYARVRLAGPPLRRGLTLGLVAWTIGQVPTWLLWYAQQPWPGTLVVKQLLLELIASLALGITIALVAGAVVWFAYPKGSSKRYQSEIHRDSGWNALGPVASGSSRTPDVSR